MEAWASIFFVTIFIPACEYAPELETPKKSNICRKISQCINNSIGVELSAYNV
jgi:hypothetical protein